MASVFTYITEPSKVLSPWLTQKEPPKICSAHTPFQGPVTSLADYGILKLLPEPSHGPLEYKLHLLLRPRRQYTCYSTGLGKLRSQNRQKAPDLPSLNCLSSSPSAEFRQNRLQQLTTQLLWRLQQSSQNHASSTSQIILPKLVEATETPEVPIKHGKLATGLEESHGALYQIGISDDGNIVGLTNDEMEESLVNLRAMAASLGCDVTITQMILVGSCEWNECLVQPGTFQPSEEKDLISSPVLVTSEVQRRQADLFVAEALITPHLTSVSITRQNNPSPKAHDPVQVSPQNDVSPLLDGKFYRTEQLRCTLIGPPGSGKSSLLGSLCTANLDNGRGKIRVSLLKHPHEIETGTTSSVAQELIGYKGLEVINYASGNVTSWTDIHESALNERLVFISDCPGNSKQNRATIRGLISLVPHWNLLCVAADNTEDTNPGNPGSTPSFNSVTSYLKLCLQLETPFAVVITKLDLASKNNLRSNLSKILSSLKAAGRIPIIFPPEQEKAISESELTLISHPDSDFAKKLVSKILKFNTITSIVPIVMSSAVKGTGIRSLHAILRYIPLSNSNPINELKKALGSDQAGCLFHINDTFSLPKFYPALSHSSDMGIIFSGHLQNGRILVGDKVLIGPFSSETDIVDSRKSKFESRDDITYKPMADAASEYHILNKRIWRKARIVSVHNLRFPVRALETDQVGTVGIVWEISQKPKILSECAPTTFPKVRKGMILTIPGQNMCRYGYFPRSTKRFIASFEKDDIKLLKVSGLVTIYTASVRASARILQLIPPAQTNVAASGTGISKKEEEPGDRQALQDSVDIPDAKSDVLIELLNSHEWIEPKSSLVLVVGDGNEQFIKLEKDKGKLGHLGFVGKVKEVLD